MTPDIHKLNQLVVALEKMIRQLTQHGNLVAHRHIDESYYLQKITELRLLGDQLEQARSRAEVVAQRLHTHYSEVYYHWKRDARWLNAYLRNVPIL